MLTRYRFTVSFLVAVVIATAGLALRNPQLTLLSIPPMFYCCAMIISAVALSSASITAHRRVDKTRIPEQESIEVSVSMASEGRSFPMVLAHDMVPNGTIVVSGNASYQGPLTPGREKEHIHYVLQGVRGVYQFSPIEALLCSRFGLAILEASIDAPIEVRVLPSREPLGSIQIRPRRTRAFAGPVRSNVPGAGVDFYGCRTFNQGDDIRRINWRAYARTDDLIICDFEQERITNVNLILDARVRAHAFVGTAHTFEFATQATASLAASFCNQGNAVGLLIYGDVLNWVFPGVGRSQTDRILDALSQARLANKIAFEELRHIPARLFPPYSQLVLVSCHLDEADIETLALLKNRGYSILFVSINTLQLEKAGLPQDADTDLALRIANLRRRLYLGSLARYGVRVVDWDPSAPLGEALERSRRMRGGRDV